MRLDCREGDARQIVGADASADPDDDEPRASERELGTRTSKGGEHETDQEHHQPAEHVQLGVQVDDHISSLAAPVEELVDGRERLHRSLQRPERERSAAG